MANHEPTLTFNVAAKTVYVIKPTMLVAYENTVKFGLVITKAMQCYNEHKFSEICRNKISGHSLIAFAFLEGEGV